VAVKREEWEAVQQRAQGAKRAYEARNPQLLAEAIGSGKMTEREAQQLLSEYYDADAAKARDEEFSLENRERVLAIARLRRAQSEHLRRQRLSPTFKMSYYDAAQRYHSEIRNQMAGQTGRQIARRQMAGKGKSGPPQGIPRPRPRPWPPHRPWPRGRGLWPVGGTYTYAAEPVFDAVGPASPPGGSEHVRWVQDCLN